VRGKSLLAKLNIVLSPLAVDGENQSSLYLRAEQQQHFFQPPAVPWRSRGCGAVSMARIMLHAQMPVAGNGLVNAPKIPLRRD